MWQAAVIGMFAAVAAVAEENNTTQTVQEAVINAPVSEIWKAFTTNDGYKAFGVAKADIDFRVGGKMRTHYDPQGTIGDPNTIENIILSFEPERMLSMKVVKAPENFPFKTAINNMWTVIHLDPIDGGHARVRVVGMGFTPEDESQKMRAFFDKGNAQVLKILQSRLGRGDSQDDAAATEKAIHSLAGEWAFASKGPDGGEFRGHMVARVMMGRSFVLAESELGDANKLSPHGHGIFGRDPNGGGMRVWDFGEQGAISSAPVTLVGGNHLNYQWVQQRAGGPAKEYFIDETLESADALRFELFDLRDSDKRGERPQHDPMVNVLWKRVGAAQSAANPASNGGAAKAASNGNDDLRFTGERFVTGKRIEREVTVAAPVEKIWRAWTTTEGVTSFFSEGAKVDLRVGGPYEIYFRKDAPEGSRGSEGCEVLSFLPKEMLSFSWNAPPENPEIRKQRTIVVVQLTDLGERGTKVKLTQNGFGEGSEWDTVRGHFEKAWPMVLKSLKETLEGTTQR